MWLTLLALMVLEGLEASEGSAASYQLMAELCLVVRVLDLVVVVLCLSYDVLSARQSSNAVVMLVGTYRNRTS